MLELDMVHVVFTFLILLTSIKTNAFDCRNAKPFKSNGVQKVNLSILRIYWDSHKTQQFEDVCHVTNGLVYSYDVRGREEDAFYCLLPQKKEILECQTKLDGSDAKVVIIPAIWIRSWNPKPVREYRFHAYVTKNTDNSYLKDIFSRSLSTNLKPQGLIIEGALKTGSSNPDDGYFIRAEFLNKL